MQHNMYFKDGDWEALDTINQYWVDRGSAPRSKSAVIAELIANELRRVSVVTPTTKPSPYNFGKK